MIGVGLNQSARSFGEQPLKIIAPAPIPAILRKSRRDNTWWLLLFMTGSTQQEF